MMTFASVRAGRAAIETGPPAVGAGVSGAKEMESPPNGVGVGVSLVIASIVARGRYSWGVWVVDGRGPRGRGRRTVAGAGAAGASRAGAGAARSALGASMTAAWTS